MRRRLKKEKRQKGPLREERQITHSFIQSIFIENLGTGGLVHKSDI